MLDSYTLFLKGIKPALLLHERQKGFKPLIKKYPYIEFVYGNRLFFQHEEQKSRFLENGIDPQANDLIYLDEEMGYVLGFPPVAVRDFIAEIPEHDRIGIDYHGVSFVVHRNHVKQALNEIKTTIPIPQTLIDEYESTVLFDHIPVAGKGFVEMSQDETKGWLT